MVKYHWVYPDKNKYGFFKYPAYFAYLNLGKTNKFCRAVQFWQNVLIQFLFLVFYFNLNVSKLGERQQTNKKTWKYM